MSGQFNGDLKRAIITGVVGLAFAAIMANGGYVIYRLNRMEERQDLFNAEQFRIGKVAADRGDRLSKLEAFQRWATDRIVELQLEMAREHRRFRIPSRE